MAIESLYELSQGNDISSSFTKLDKHSSSEVTAMESFLVPASSEVNEVDEIAPRHGLTSFLSDDTQRQNGNQPVTIADGRLLSAHTNITKLAELNCSTDNDILNNANPLLQHTTEKTTATTMAPPTVQRVRRVKYKEASAVDPVLHEQAHAAQPAQLAPTAPPTVSSSTITSERNNITHTEQGTEQAATLAKETAKAQQAPTPHSSSSLSSDQNYSSPDIDSAVDMKGGSRRRHKPASTNEDQEVLFQGRRLGGPSNATSNSKKYDSANGVSASKAGGETDRPALAAKSTNQTTSNKTGHPVAMTKAHSSMTGQTSWRPEPAKKQPIQESESKPPMNSWDTGHPPLPHNARINGGSPNKPLNFNGRTRIDRKPKKPRESPWIKDSLIPKGDPKRHQTRWTPSSHESSPSDSKRASSGWGTRRKREDDGAALGDWSGNMAPALIDWDCRAPFRDQQTELRIDNWVGTVSSELAAVGELSFTDGAKTFSFTTTPSGKRDLIPQEQGDVVPRYWIPTPAEDKGETLGVFWEVYISRENRVKPVDEDDLNLAKPWWQRYVDAKSCMLQEYKHPLIAGNDPDETETERLAREFDTGGQNASANRKEAEKAKRDAQRKRKLDKMARAHKYAGIRNSSTAPPMPNSIKPGLNLFLRSANKGDMIQLRDLYNRYIDNTFVVPETSRRTESDMLHRLKAANDAKLPFIVAVQRGEVVKARNKKQNGGEDMVMSDRVVGFGCAVDWNNSEGTIYRATVQIEVFVGMDHYMKNIGSCLIDKMMGLLDPSFIERGGYDTVGEELDGVGPSRVVANVMIRYSYDSQNTEKLAWVSEWFGKRLGFQKVADLQGVAQKFDRKLNLAILQKTI